MKYVLLAPRTIGDSRRYHWVDQASPLREWQVKFANSSGTCLPGLYEVRAWSDQNHFASLSYYKDLILPPVVHEKRYLFMEDVHKSRILQDGMEPTYGAHMLCASTSVTDLNPRIPSEYIGPIVKHMNGRMRGC